MLIPDGLRAVVDEEKITAYLLNAAHPDGAAKVAFFFQFGFNPEEWGALADALVRHLSCNPILTRVDSVFGARYTVDGKLETPDGRNPMVRTVWIADRGSKTIRLITAHPGKKERKR